MRRELGAAIVLLIVLYLFFITVKKMDSFKVNSINHNGENFRSFVVYNRVPKCGSSTLKSIVNQLRFRNGFVSIDSLEKDPYFGKMLMHQNVGQVAETKKLIQRLDNKTVFTEHSHFVNLDSTAVAYINLIRDPIARVNSAYCYARDLTKEFGKHQTINNRSQSLHLGEFPIGSYLKVTDSTKSSVTFLVLVRGIFLLYHLKAYLYSFSLTCDV